MKKLFNSVPKMAWLVIAVALIGLLLPDHAIPAMGLVGFGGMIIDAQTLLSDAQALSATGFSTNTLDTALATNNIPAGEPLAAHISVDVAADAASGDETYQFQVVQSANADLSSQDILVQTDTGFVTRAFLVAGRRLVIPIPPNLKTKRYLGVRYVLGGTTPSITVTTEIIPLSFAQLENVYPKNFIITS